MKKLSKPLWFQAFGCALGFDWHSSGLTTLVTAVLKQSISVESYGIPMRKGKKRPKETFDKIRDMQS